MEREETSSADAARPRDSIGAPALRAGSGEVPPSEVFRFMATYYIYQDQIGWNRTQTLVIVEAGVLAGAFARQGPLSPLLLVLGTLVIHWLFRLIQRDWQVRDKIGATLDAVTKAYAIEIIPVPPHGVVRGRTIVTRVSNSLIATNLLLAVLRTVQVAGWSWAGDLHWLLG